MPREKIDLPYQIEHLSILDEEGNLDESLEPDIPEDTLVKLYETMVLGRRFDERLLALQRQGRIGTFAPISGQEAAQIGAIATLEESDWFVPSFRETGAALWRGQPMKDIIIFSAGYNEGIQIPEGSHNLPIAVPVSSQILHAVGIGYGINYREEKDVVMVFFGDGATSEGDFHEGLNFAGVFQTPVVFVCQNNQWAISVPRKRQTASETLAQKALAYGVPGIQVDGNDVLAVFAAAAEAVERSRDGGGPTMIEAVTYRMSVHTTADDPKKYRSEEEVEEWKERDPIERFQKYLRDKELLDDEKIEEIDAQIKERIQNAVDEAEEAIEDLGDPLDMFDHMYAEMPSYLKSQKEELEAELAQDKEE